MGAPNTSYQGTAAVRSDLSTANGYLSSIQTSRQTHHALGGNSASVTSGAAVLVLAGTGENYKAREVMLRPVGGDVYLADDSGVGATNGVLVKDGEVVSFQNYTGALYAIAVSATVTVYYGYTSRT